MLKKSFAVLHVKAVDEEKRIIRGIATTPTTDRVGDVIDPMGGKVVNPKPLLWQHDSLLPVGTVEFGKATPKGIPFEAKIPMIDSPSQLKARVDEAWMSVKTGLVACVSIGFNALEWSVNEMTGGLNFLKWEMLELSLVTIPANPDAVITGIKSMDSEIRAALGKKGSAPIEDLPSGVTEKVNKTVKLTPKEAKTMTIKTQEQIKNFKAERAAKFAKMSEIMALSAANGETLDEANSEQYDTLDAEVKQIDKHLERLEVLAKNELANATPVTEKAGQTTQAATETRKASVVLAEKSEPGIAMARIARCIGLGRGSMTDAREFAKSLYQHDNKVVEALAINKAVVSGGSTTDTTWAKPLVDTNSAVADFVEYLRPRTILGQFGANGIPALRNVPFYTKLVGQTSGGAANWVGEGKAKPVTKFDFVDTTLLPLKVAAIAVATEELLRNSSPSADRLIRDSLVEAARERLDIDFVDPAKAAAAGVSPASITYGVTPVVATGTGDVQDIICDLNALWGNYIAARVNPRSAVYIMGVQTALALSLMLNAFGQPEFPELTMNGGFLKKVPVIVSEYVDELADTAGGYVFLVNAEDVYLGDDGGFQLDFSREATIQMDTAPTQSSIATVTATTGVSMFQTNSVAFRAERIINWSKRRSSAVQVLSGVNWGAC